MLFSFCFFVDDCLSPSGRCTLGKHFFTLGLLSQALPQAILVRFCLFLFASSGALRFSLGWWGSLAVFSPPPVSWFRVVWWVVSRAVRVVFRAVLLFLASSLAARIG